MRVILTIIVTILLVSCSTKYNGLHSDFEKFNKDIDYCLKKSCKNKKSVINNFSIISSALAYGGGGGGGAGSSLLKETISYKTFNLCLKEKGYTKDKNGIFEMPYLACD